MGKLRPEAKIPLNLNSSDPNAQLFLLAWGSPAGFIVCSGYRHLQANISRSGAAQESIRSDRTSQPVLLGAKSLAVCQRKRAQKFPGYRESFDGE